MKIKLNILRYNWINRLWTPVATFLSIKFHCRVYITTADVDHDTHIEWIRCYVDNGVQGHELFKVEPR